MEYRQSGALTVKSNRIERNYNKNTSKILKYIEINTLLKIEFFPFYKIRNSIIKSLIIFMIYL